MAVASRLLDGGSGYVAPSRVKLPAAEPGRAFLPSVVTPQAVAILPSSAPVAAPASHVDDFIGADGNWWHHGGDFDYPVAPMAYVAPVGPAGSIDLTRGFTRNGDSDAPSLSLGQLVTDTGGSFLASLGFTGPTTVTSGSGADALQITNPAATRYLVDSGIQVRQSTYADAGLGDAPMLVTQGFTPGGAAIVDSRVSQDQDDDPGNLFGWAFLAGFGGAIASVVAAGGAAGGAAAAGASSGAVPASAAFAAPTNAALIESAVGTAGYGASSAGLGGGIGSLAGIVGPTVGGATSAAAVPAAAATSSAWTVPSLGSIAGGLQTAAGALGAASSIGAALGLTGGGSSRPVTTPTATAHAPAWSSGSNVPLLLGAALVAFLVLKD